MQRHRVDAGTRLDQLVELVEVTDGTAAGQCGDGEIATQVPPDLDDELDGAAPLERLEARPGGRHLPAHAGIEDDGVGDEVPGCRETGAPVGADERSSRTRADARPGQRRLRLPSRG